MINRLFNVLKAHMNYGKKIPNVDPSEYENYFSDNSSSKESSASTSNSSGFPQQVIDDLAVFGLTPPASFDDVKKARNQEMRKYHPDKFNSEEDKGEAANEIAQIYNEAFSRLKDYYEKK